MEEAHTSQWLPYLAQSMKVSAAHSLGLIGALWVGASSFQKGPVRQASMLPRNLKGITQAWGAFYLTPPSHNDWLSLKFLYEVLWERPHGEVGNTMLPLLINFPRALYSKPCTCTHFTYIFTKARTPEVSLASTKMSLLPKMYLFFNKGLGPSTYPPFGKLSSCGSDLIGYPSDTQDKSDSVPIIILTQIITC